MDWLRGARWLVLFLMVIGVLAAFTTAFGALSGAGVSSFRSWGSITFRGPGGDAVFPDVDQSPLTLSIPHWVVQESMQAMGLRTYSQSMAAVLVTVGTVLVLALAYGLISKLTQ